MQQWEFHLCKHFNLVYKVSECILFKQRSDYLLVKKEMELTFEFIISALHSLSQLLHHLQKKHTAQSQSN